MCKGVGVDNGQTGRGKLIAGDAWPPGLCTEQRCVCVCVCVYVYVWGWGRTGRERLVPASNPAPWPLHRAEVLVRERRRTGRERLSAVDTQALASAQRWQEGTDGRKEGSGHCCWGSF
ncbi:unnamed protein product [Caretta caretta]